jgi:hypothetical protein
MATITNLVGATDTVNDTTLVTGATYTVTANDFVVVIVACPNSGASGAAPTITVDDSDGLNTYTERKILNRDPGAAGDGTTLGIFTSTITDAVTNGTVTVTLSDAAGSKTVQIYRIRPATNEVISYSSAGVGSTGNANSFTGASAVSVTNGDIIFGCVSLEDNGACTGDSDTTNGSWSTIVTRIADNGSDTNSTTQGSQYKQVTATGNQTWSGATSDGTSKQFAADYIIVNVDKVLTANAGSYAITGTAASPLRGRKVDATTGGSYAITGTDVSISSTGSRVVNAEAGSYAITGTDASTLQAWKTTAATDSYAITGTDTPVLHGWLTDATTGGTYTITGTDASMVYGHKVIPDAAGSYAITGTDVAIQRSTAKSIAALAGSYTITGTDATTTHTSKITAAAGSYAITGTDATFVRTFSVFPASGSYTLTGTDVTLTKTLGEPVRVAGYLEVASFSHSLVIKRPPSILSVDSHTFGLSVDNTTPRLKAASHTHTLKVRS